MTRMFFAPAAGVMLLTLTALAPGGAAAQEMASASMSESGKPACTAPIAPGGELAPWAAPTALTAGSDIRRLPPLAIGQAARVALLPTPQVKYPLRPEKPGGSVSHGGMIAITVAQAGTYRVALSSGAWIDLVRDGAAVTSVAHGHGPDCTGVRKMVDYRLTPGRYTLQLAASGEPQITVLVARLP